MYYLSELCESGAGGQQDARGADGGAVPAPGRPFGKGDAQPH